MSPLGLIYCVTALSAVVMGSDKSDFCSQQLSTSLWSYHVDLLKNLVKKAAPEENILVSPLSSYIALSALHLGAGKGTRADLAKIMKIPVDSKELADSNLHENLAKVMTSLQPNTTDSIWSPLTRVELANGLFVHKNFPVKESYTKQLKDYYNGTASNVDFTKGNEATELINNWISQKTMGRIPKFYDEPLGAETLAILLSTLYFNARWKEEFSKWNTKEEKFNTGSTEITVPMMTETDFVQYESNPSLKYDSISIPYVGGEFGMKIFLPHPSQTVNNLTDHLHLMSPQTLINAAKSTNVEYKIPKMKFSWKKSLAEALNAQSIFDSPDLSELTPISVKISKMIHAAEIEVDEEGTTASAVTAAQVVPSSARVSLTKPIQFHVNRPFLFGITHKSSCSILFSGTVHKPI